MLNEMLMNVHLKEMRTVTREMFSVIISKKEELDSNKLFDILWINFLIGKFGIVGI